MRTLIVVCLLASGVAACSTQTQKVIDPNAAGGSVWTPSPSASWLWDLDNANVPVPSVSSAHVQDYNAQVYDVDMFNTTTEQLAVYHRAGKKVVCYINAGGYESGRPDRGAFDPNCYCGPGYVANDGCLDGSPHKMEGWPEWWFDVSNDACGASVRTAIAARIALAAQKGCDGVEPDNTDSYVNNVGWSTTLAEQTDYNVWLAQAAHGHGLSIALKNCSDMLSDDTAGPALVQAFDFSLNEQCHAFDECDVYAGFISASKAAFNAEYPGSTAQPTYCGTPGMKTLQYDSLAVEYGNLLSVCPE